MFSDVPTVSEKIANWVVKTNYSNIPAKDITTAKRLILDFIGVSLAGVKDPFSKLITKYLQDIGCNKESTVIALRTKTSCIEAAFANGMLGHYLDYDDTLIPAPNLSGIHITAPILPAAFAVGEREKKSGKEVLEAYILGCEIAYRIGQGLDPSHSTQGWHPTATKGTFGATIASSKLFGLNEEETAYAIGIAGSAASGVLENVGTLAKPFNVGHAAANGVRAATLARLGFDSAKSIFEGKNGYCRVASTTPNVSKMTENLGKPFCIDQVRLKLHPSCSKTHTPIEAMLNLVTRHNLRNLSPNDIEEIKLICEPSNTLVDRIENPETGLLAKFSLPYCLSLALMYGEVTMPHFKDEKVKDPHVAAMMEKVKIVTNPDFQATEKPTRSSVVEITLKDGRKLTSERVHFPQGSTENPASDERVLQKYRDCARETLSERNIEKSIETIMHLEKIDNIGELLALLSG